MRLGHVCGSSVITPFSEFSDPPSGGPQLDQVAGLTPLEWALQEVASVQEPHTWPHAFAPSSGPGSDARKVST